MPCPQPLTVIIERDGRFPPIARLLEQLDLARTAWRPDGRPCPDVSSPGVRRMSWPGSTRDEAALSAFLSRTTEAGARSAGPITSEDCALAGADQRLVMAGKPAFPGPTGEAAEPPPCSAARWIWSRLRSITSSASTRCVVRATTRTGASTWPRVRREVVARDFRGCQRARTGSRSPAGNAARGLRLRRPSPGRPGPSLVRARVPATRKTVTTSRAGLAAVRTQAGRRCDRGAGSAAADVRRARS